MISAPVTVTQIRDGHVWVESTQKYACGSCAQKASCVSATLVDLLPKHELDIEYATSLNVGDTVELVISEGHLLSSSLLLYVLPILIMLIIVGLLNAFFPQAQDAMPEISLFALLSTFWLIHRFHSPHQNQVRLNT